MRHAVFALLAATILAAGTGCSALHRVFARAGDDCESCEVGNCETCGHLASESQVAPASLFGHRTCRNCGKALPPPQGPPAGAVAYPYYTTRGPRDFLAGNPPGIGR